MKRFILILSSLFLIAALTACGSGSHTLNTDYSGEIQATDGKINYIGRLESGGEDLRLSMSAPESVAGLTYTLQNGELHTGLNGLDCITPPDSLPKGSLPSLLCDVFPRLDEAVFQSADNGTDTFTLETGLGTACITAKNGTPLTLTAGNMEVWLTDKE